MLRAHSRSRAESYKLYKCENAKTDVDLAC